MRKIFNWVVNKRLLDGYIGILGFVTHYKILAMYFSTLYIFDLSTRNIISISLSYQTSMYLRENFYPLGFIFKLFLFNKKIIDTGADGNKRVHDSVSKSMKERKQKAEELKKQYPEIAEHIS